MAAVFGKGTQEGDEVAGLPRLTLSFEILPLGIRQKVGNPRLMRTPRVGNRTVWGRQLCEVATPGVS
jgi:hypothetical protein